MADAAPPAADVVPAVVSREGALAASAAGLPYVRTAKVEIGEVVLRTASTRSSA